MTKSTMIWLAVAVFMWGCQNGERGNTESNEEPNGHYPVVVKDNYSYAKPNEAIIRHLDLDIEVSFGQKKITGKAVFQIENKTGADKIYFDTKSVGYPKIRKT